MYCFFLLCLTVSLFANEDAARNYYLNKNYDTAAMNYEKLVKKSPNNAAYAYNLGATYYRLNQPILAKYYFLKALKSRPTLNDAKLNIKLINQALIDQTLIYKSYWLNFFGLSFKALSLIVLLGLFSIMSLLVFSRSKIPYTRRMLIMGLLIWLPITAITVGTYLNHPSFGILFDDKATIYSGPSLTQKTLFYIHKGVDFKINKTTNNWANVEFSNGLSGWLETKYINQI